MRALANDETWMRTVYLVVMPTIGWFTGLILAMWVR